MQNLPPGDARLVTPLITVSNVQASVDFYNKAFGFTLHIRPILDGSPEEYSYMNYMGKIICLLFAESVEYNGIALLSPKNSDVNCPITPYIFCNNIDNFFENALQNDATSVMPPEDKKWGDRIAYLKDIDGYVWCFATQIENS